MSGDWNQHIELENDWVRLIPADPVHAEELAAICSVDTFKFFVRDLPRTIDAPGLTDFVNRLIATPNVQPYTVVDKLSGNIAGMTCFMDIRAAHLGLEIGWTWYGPQFRGTKVNPAAKLLLITHAMEELGAIRVQLKCDERNLHSQRAIEKLGAVKEGVLRQHGIQLDGTIRNSVMYSVTKLEWPSVKANLLSRCQL
ncbi:RimL Acetyltransferases, including N-acetylases of ribosomal proteins [Fimbriimonadaceae bacterium]